MRLFKSSVEKKVQDLSHEAQEKINELYSAVNDIPVSGSSLDQVGLRNGKEIIEDYLRHGELGLAVDHLKYMISETDLVLKESSKKVFNSLIKDYAL